MGTRHLIVVFYKGKYHIAQYGQWDGYPSGQGIKVLEFLKEPENVAKLQVALDNDLVFSPTKEQLTQYEAEIAQATVQQQNSTSPDSRLYNITANLYPSLSRDTGADILKLVANASVPVPIEKDLAFIHNGLFCEWAYVVDLDATMLEVWASSMVHEGADRSQTRFAEIEPPVDDAPGAVVSDGHGPGLVYKYEFHNLPSKEDFLKDCERDVE